MLSVGWHARDMSVMDQFRVVLVSPLYGGNVGSVCRAMANMGLDDLVLVAPDVLNMVEARKMACHAKGILESRREVATLGEATADCVAVAGTTARRGLYRQHAQSPREWAQALVERAAGGRVALVFGREDKGLLNEEVAMCSHLIQIPTASTYASLNLSQAVMVCCYELFQAGGEAEPLEEKSGLVPGRMRERMCAIWRELLLEVGFMEEAKGDHMMQGVRRIFARGALTEDDAHILMGVARQASWAAHADPEQLPCRDVES